MQVRNVAQIWPLYTSIRLSLGGVPIVAQWLTNPIRNHEVVGSVPSLGPSICCECGRRKDKKKSSFVALPSKGGHSRLTPSNLCSPLREGGKGSYRFNSKQGC